MKHPPACGDLWPLMTGDIVGATHGDVHRCVKDAGHSLPYHRCACGRFGAVYESPISAVMESDQ